MGFSKTDAITLRRIDYKDSSQIVTFYTGDYGKIQTLAKGVKHSVKGISRGIDLLTYIKSHSSEKVKLSGGTIATVNYLISKRVQNTGRLSINSFIQNEIKKVLRYYLSFILNKKLKMWRYL